jgi:hypothetical protein
MVEKSVHQKVHPLKPADENIKIPHVMLQSEPLLVPHTSSEAVEEESKLSSNFESNAFNLLSS